MADKIFNDPIHGHIEISALAVKVIDTPHFQRLRDISQLGGVYMVFPGASSNRFEHSLGVCYLARVFLKHLRENQPDLIQDKDALCVEIAALCHDLGHGPFSHLFDGRFLPKAYANKNEKLHFHHEHASIALFDLLIEENNLSPVFEQFGLGPDDIHFIKELILGDEEEAPEGFVWKGRGLGKEFLYDIVANKRNGIDVDKFDYFARDCHVLGLSKSFDALRLMKFARVFPVAREEGEMPGKTEICFHVKEAWNILELFHTRYTLHKRAYQHRVANVMELMLCEMLLLADPFVRIPAYPEHCPEEAVGAPMLTMSESVQNMQAYWRLSEYIVKVIEFSTSVDLMPARALLHRIRRRDLYGFGGETILTSEMMHKLKAEQVVSLGEGNDDSSNQSQPPAPPSLESIVKRQLWAIISDDVLAHTAAVKEEDLFCYVVKMGYGKGNENPLTRLTTFYQPDKTANGGNGAAAVSPLPKVETKWKLGSLPEDAVSRIIPREFEEVFVRVFTRHKAQQNYVQEIFSQWCNTQRATQSVLVSNT